PPAGERGEIARMLFVEALLTGLGSNPVGLDRGKIRQTSVLHIRRLGNRVLFEEPNLSFRALSDDPAERRATRQSFAPSVRWGADVAALDADGRSLVDLAPLLLSDRNDVVSTLKDTGQGAYALDPQRSAVDFAAVHVFPDNVELEALLTYGRSGPEEGPLVADTAPEGSAFSLVQHVSFVRLPDDGYRTRKADPRIGFFGIDFADYAAGLDERIETRFITRHRLEKVDPTAATSRAVEPIVYYVDPGAPEPVRSALIEGARWWAEAFEAAGFEDAYRVEVLPADAHPLDVRYNVIQWVHRSTRGWSYGGGVVDPRTGEMIKGHVSLGSLRVRQDRLIFEGLLGTEDTGSGGDRDPIEIALARIRQLSAHEVGHTLGITHNFAASTYGDRASVMDYPAPWIQVAEDESGEPYLDVSRAYGVGVGAWDVHTVRYGYSQFPPGADEEAELEKIVREGLDAGYLFLADRDARPPFASDPRANLWDNGDDAVAALESVLAVRRFALDRFGEGNLPPGSPVTYLEEVLAPIYFYHRYQLEAAVKAVGGMEIHYALRGDGQIPTRILEGEHQRRALDTVLGILEPSQLDLPEPVLALLVPRAFRIPPNRELFASSTSPSFDALGAAATATDQVIDGLFQPHRLARLMDFHRRDAALPGVEEVVGAVLDRGFAGPRAGEGPREAALREVVRTRVVRRLIAAAGNPEATDGVRARLEAALGDALARLEASSGAADRRSAREVRRFLERPASPFEAESKVAPPPPGSPIGQDGSWPVAGGRSSDAAASGATSCSHWNP
ncbi:MAG: zinc-dependent metalloprotease, partial [Holophagales bacterium]|nr:zinc-dependent metalloprotease [Holophagales bacterium]